jgi:hypothetical protein
VTGSAHLRGIVIAGVLAAVALALGFMTLGMNQTASPAAAHTILPLKLRHHVAAASTTKTHVAKKAHVTRNALAATTAPATKKAPATRKALGTRTAPATTKALGIKKTPHVMHVDPNFTAALKAGLPRSVAQALAAHPVVVVQLTSQGDQVAQLALGEARVGATLGGASLVTIDVDANGGDVEVLTRLLGKLPVAPATLVYIRPATLYVTLLGFNDRTIIQQAAANAAAPPASTSIAPSASSATTTSSG